MPVPDWLRALLHHAGWDEKRCVACLEPFAPPLFIPRTTAPPPAASDISPALQTALCPACAARLPRRRAGYCPHCGEVAADPQAPCAPCGACLQDPPPWTAFRFYGVFEGPLRDLLHRAKYASDVACLEVLGRLLADICADLPRTDAIVPMPLHPERLRRRGYNQCREMARPLGRMLGVPVRDDLLLRQRHTPPQTGLNRRERHLNLRDAFLGRDAADGLRILLIDDTATTGASLRGATEALLRAGAVRVDVAVAARASVHSPAAGISAPQRL